MLDGMDDQRKDRLKQSETMNAQNVCLSVLERSLTPAHIPAAG